jgi:hypothetical protein
MALPRAFSLLVLVALLPALAGCSFTDWYKQRGTVYIELAPEGSAGTALGDFRKLTIAVYGVSLKKVGSVEPYEFSFGESPLLVDLVERGRAGTTVPLAENVTNLRAFETVTVRIDVVEALDAGGKGVPGCHPGQPVPSRPCVSTPVNGAYRAERQFSPPRGGDVTFRFPLSVQFDASANEYYIQMDPDAIQLIAND